ncbi:MAG: hypothetical protein WA652_14065, partial [Xanthobacteraceae bacterium]
MTERDKKVTPSKRIRIKTYSSGRHRTRVGNCFAGAEGKPKTGPVAIVLQDLRSASVAVPNMQVTAALERCPRQPGREERYNRAMDEPTFTALSAWLTQAGLAGMSESEIVTGLCERCVAAGLPLGRA